MKKRVTQKPTSKQSSPVHSHQLFVLFLFVILLVSVVAILQGSNQDIRNRAQEITPTPMLRCDVECTYNSQCPSGLFCHQGVCRNPSCPDTSGCACVITPTPNPQAFQPTKIPNRVATVRPTATPSLNPTNRPTASVSQFPTIVLSPTPVSPYEAYATEPKNLTFFQAVMSYIGNVFCRLFRMC